MIRQSEIVAACLARGFRSEPKTPHFGEEFVTFEYLRRGLTYVSITGYDPDYYDNVVPRTYAEMRADASPRTRNGPRVHDGQFCEGVYEVYLAPKNTRAKGVDETKKGERHSEFQRKGYLPVVIRSFRSLDELIALDSMPQAG